LDEPTVGLDVESAILVRKMIKELKGNGMTILLTTHNMFEAEELCDNIAFINRGKIVSIGTPKELKSKIMSTRTVEIHCSDESCVLSSLKSLPGVKAKVKSPQIVHVNVTDYKKMKDIMLVLSSCKGEIYSVNELEPTFEEIYIKMINQSQGDSHE
jgi:ABC-2 type transport system ATP-binding protein